MKNMYLLLRVILLSFCTQSLLVGAQSYYDVIGAARNAPSHDIRGRCIGKLAEVNTKLEPERKDKQARLDDIKAGKISGTPADIAALQNRVNELYQQITFIKGACEILQDPKQKANYDKTLGGIISEEETAKKEVEEAKKYCEEREVFIRDTLEVSKQDLERYKQNATADKRQAYQNQIVDVDKRIADIRRDCLILTNSKNPAFQATLARFREEQKAGLKAYDEGIFGSIQKGIDGARKDIDVKISNLAGNILSTIPIPDVGARIFNQDLAMRNMKILPVPSGPNIRKGIGFTGTMNFNTFQVKGTMYVVEDKDRKVQCSFSMMLPENYKISNILPAFKAMDVLSLPQGKFVISSFEYKDPDGYDIKVGFNFASRLELTGPLQALDTLMKKAKQLDSIVVRLDAIRFQGIIPRDLMKASFGAKIPLQIGLDFTKIPKMPKSITDIIKEFTTDELEFTVAFPASMSIESGVRLVLGTQKDPIRLSLLGIISPQVISIGVRLRNMLDLYIVALGNAGIQIDLDQALMPAAIALGVPFTGIGMHGEIDLGTAGPKRVVLKIAGGVRVSGTSIPDLVLELEADNLDIGNIINLVSKVMAKAGISRELPADKMPIMKIDTLKGYLVLEDTKIANKSYAAGFGLALNAQLFDKKFGFSFDIKHKQLKVSGMGYMSKVDLVLDGKRIITMSGPGLAGITSDGPVVSCDFDFSSAAKILEGTFKVQTALEIPPIDLKSTVNLVIQGKSFKADIEMMYAGFTAIFGINLDPSKWQEMYLKFGFKGDFEKYLSENAKPALIELRKEANAKLAQVDAKIGDLSKALRGVQSQGVSDTQREIDKTRARIRTLESKIAALRRECDTASTIAKVYVCPRVGAELVSPGAELAGQKTYLEGLLKPGKEVIRSTTGALADASKAVAEAELFKKTVLGLITALTKAVDGISTGLNIFKITEAIGEVSAKDLGQSKLPKLISFVASINIPDLPSVKVDLKNIQFDFKNPKGSTLEIAKKLVSSIKLG